VVVWEAGLAFQAASTPALEAWSVAADISQSFAGDEAMHDAAMQVAERGAGLAEAAGMPATSVTVADETTVAQTLIRVAQERDAVAIAVGAHSRRGAHRLGLGSTSKELVEHAPCPVIVVREPAAL
jgi:nucleotide-binding universal stress UspA family protein